MNITTTRPQNHWIITMVCSVFLVNSSFQTSWGQSYSAQNSKNQDYRSEFKQNIETLIQHIDDTLAQSSHQLNEKEIRGTNLARARTGLQKTRHSLTTLLTQVEADETIQKQPRLKRLGVVLGGIIVRSPAARAPHPLIQIGFWSTVSIVALNVILDHNGPKPYIPQRQVYQLQEALSALSTNSLVAIQTMQKSLGDWLARSSDGQGDRPEDYGFDIDFEWQDHYGYLYGMDKSKMMELWNSAKQGPFCMPGFLNCLSGYYLMSKTTAKLAEDKVLTCSACYADCAFGPYSGIWPKEKECNPISTSFN